MNFKPYMVLYLITIVSLFMGVLNHVTSGRKPFFTRLTAERLLSSVYPTMIHHHKFTMKPAAADITLVPHIIFVH